MRDVKMLGMLAMAAPGALLIAFMAWTLLTPAGVRWERGWTQEEYAQRVSQGQAKRLRAELAAEVVRGNMSFEEAGCRSRGGEWKGGDWREPDRKSFCAEVEPLTPSDAALNAATTYTEADYQADLTERAKDKPTSDPLTSAIREAAIIGYEKRRESLRELAKPH